LADVLFLAISVRPIISTFTGPIFTKFAGLAELWPYVNDLKLSFRSVATNFVGKIDLQYSPYSSHDIRQGGAAGIRQEEHSLLYRAQAKKLPDSMDAGEPIKNN